MSSYLEATTDLVRIKRDLAVTGNVGIGTAVPLQKLHVVGNTRIEGDAIVTGKWEVQGTTTYIDTYTAVTSNVTINNASGNGPALRVTQSGVGANYPIADFYDSDVSTTVPALRIADGGNVGVGTANPLQKLHVEGSVLANGNVGIGTFMPQGKLHVQQQSNDGSSYILESFDTTERLFPPKPFTDVTTLVVNNHLYGNGTYTVTQSGIFGNNISSLGGWRAFNDDITTIYRSSSPYTLADFTTTNPQYIILQLPSPIILTKYTMYQPVDTTIGNPKDWQIRASNDGVNWTIIDTQTNIIWSNAEIKVFVLSAIPTSFNYYQIYITRVSGTTSVRVYELKYYGYIKNVIRDTTCDQVQYMSGLIVNGNIGVGTTSPLEVLHVQGSVLATTQHLGPTTDTVLAPSFSWTGDTNTGMYHPGADKLGLVTAGVERVSVLDNGNVGIGTTNPQATLHVINNTANSTLMQLGYTGYNGINVSVGANNASGAPDYIYMGCKPSMSGGSGGGNFEPFITLVNTLPRNYADLCLVQNGGNVGIGITNPQAKLHVSGGILLSNDILSSYDSTLYGSTTAYATPVFLKIGYKALTVGNGNGGVLVSAGDIQIKAQGLSWSVAESDEPKGGEIYIQGGRSAFGTPGSGSSGSVIIRTHGTSRTTGFDRLTVTGNGTIVFNAYGAGTVSTNSSGVITVSDGRYKSKTRTLNTGLEQVMLLKPTYYKWNADSPWASEYEELGFVAQEVALVIPEASPEPEQADKFRNYHDRAILAVAIKAIQELKVEIEILKEKLAQMTSSS